MSSIYNELKKIDKDEFLSIIEVGIRPQMCDAIVRAAHSIYDYDWLLEQYILLLKHPDSEIRGVTITCIGHLARVHTKADKKQLLKILEPLLSEVDLSGRVEDAIDDINTYLESMES